MTTTYDNGRIVATPMTAAAFYGSRGGIPEAGGAPAYTGAEAGMQVEVRRPEGTMHTTWSPTATFEAWLARRGLA